MELMGLEAQQVQFHQLVGLVVVLRQGEELVGLEALQILLVVQVVIQVVVLVVVVVPSALAVVLLEPMVL
jgi:hypothetical protein